MRFTQHNQSNVTQTVVEATDNQVQEKEPGKVVLKVEGLYKKFCRNLKRSMIYGMTDLAKGFLGIRPKTDELRKDEFWALKGIDFELYKGETLGIIGVNGAGKSTLLRILTGIYPPDRGSVWIDGKVGGIIALGAGMHPHLTGRENIYLNGTILGLNRDEINSKFDEIVDFAELGDFLEAPLSTYSSGMKVRLGFAVAVFVNPAVLLIDEVFSVGDLRFQAKCTRKIEEMKSNSSTIFISHSMRHINRICSRALLLEDGKISMNATPSEVIAHYYDMNFKEESSNQRKVFFQDSSLKSVDVIIKSNSYNDKIYFEDKFEIVTKVNSSVEIDDLLISYSVYNTDGVCVTFINNENNPFKISEGDSVISCSIDSLKLVPGKYYLKAKMQQRRGGVIYESDTDIFTVSYIPNNYRPVMGIYSEQFKWQIYNDK